EDLVGVVTFATRPESLSPLTLSHKTLLDLLKAEKARKVPGESETNISDALALGLYRLRAAGPRRKILILPSDGEHNGLQPRSAGTPRQAAQVAANLNVPVYAIDAGGIVNSDREGGSKTLATTNREEGIKTLQEVARISGGKYFKARNTQALLEVCQEIDQ